MATEWISPTWRMPEQSNQSKFENYSLEFNGTNDEIDCAATYLNAVSNFSISTWFTTDSVANADKFLINIGSSSSELWGVQLYQGDLIVYGGSNIKYFRYNGHIATGQWYNLVVSYNGSESASDRYKVYLNGSLLSTSSISGTIDTVTPTFTTNLVIGKLAYSAAAYWNGKITEVAIYDSTLTSDPITALYNSGTPVNPMALTPLPVAYYPLGGSSTGSASTLTIPNESVPSATVFDFDGSDDRISIPEFTFSGEFTLSMWVNPEAITGTNTFILGRWDNNFDNDINVKNEADGSSTIKLRIGGTALTFYGYLTNPDGVIPLNTWSNIVLTRDSSNLITCYVDSIQFSTSTFTNTNTLTLDSIGRVINNSYGWEGFLSNIQFWDKGLSSPEVTTLYNNGVPYTGTQPQAVNLKAWYKMNVDTSTWDGTDWTISNSSANYPNSLQFNGTSSYIDTSSFTTSGDDVTISVWLKAVNLSSGTSDILFGNNSNFIRYNLNEVIYARINGVDAYLIANSGGVPQIFGTGNWHHLAVVKSGSTVTWYIDGNPYTTLGSGTTGGFTMNYIGANGSALNEFLDGQLSNVAIFESALDASAITTLYNGGQPETAISSSPLSWWKLDNLSTGIQDSGSASNNGTNYGATISGIAVSQVNGTSSGMTTANLVNSDLTRSIPYSSYSMYFDGTADRINTSLIALGLENTISFWAKRNGTDNLDGMIFGGPAAANYYTIFITSVNNLNYRIGSGANAFTNADIVSTLGANEWFHCALVRNNSGADVLCYINGDLKETLTGITGSGNNTIVQNIGARWNTNDFYITCNLSNIGVWSSALTQDQILTIYNGGVPNDISSLSPVSWWSLAGDSYFNGNDFICPDLGSGGNNGTSSGMGGTELVGDGPGSTANGIATSMDIPANLKGNAPNSSKNAFSVNMNSADRVEDVPA